MLRVVWSDGRSDDRFARLDPGGCTLRLRQVSKQPNGKVDIGNEDSVELTQISRSSITGSALQLDKKGGGLLVLHLETPDVAKAWQRGIEEVLQVRSGASAAGAAAAVEGAAGPARAAAGSGPPASEVQQLRELLGRQEERAVGLEGLNKRKEEQLLKLHARLEEALLVLQAGQATYAEQQKVLEAQQARIEELKLRAAQNGTPAAASRAPGGSPSAVSGPAARGGGGGSAAGRAAAADALSAAVRAAAEADLASPPAGGEADRDGEAGTESNGGTDQAEEADSDADTEAENAAGEMAALARRAEELQRQLEELGAAAAGATAAGPRGGGAAASAQQAAVAQQVMRAAPELLGHLQSLIQEKDRLEAQLRQEQEELEQQLHTLQAQMHAHMTEASSMGAAGQDDN